MESASTLVLMSGTLGDTALVTPLLCALARQTASPPLVLARAEFLPVLNACRFPLQAVGYDRPPWNTLFQENPADVAPAVQQTLRQARLIVNLLDTTDGAVQRHLKQWGTERVIDIPARPPAAWPRSVAAYYLEKAGLQGEDLKQDLLQVALARKMQARSDLQHHARHAGRPIVLLHPGSGGLAKCWAMDRFEALADQARAVLINPLFLIGPDEVERFGERMMFTLQAHAPVLGPMALEDAIAHAAACDLYVGNDAGLTHVAGLLGIPTVALFGPTNPRLWRPCGSRVSVIHKARMTDISVGEVLGAVEQGLG